MSSTTQEQNCEEMSVKGRAIYGSMTSHVQPRTRVFLTANMLLLAMSMTALMKMTLESNAVSIVGYTVEPLLTTTPDVRTLSLERSHCYVPKYLS